jgi:hypothetical protein
VPEEPAIGRSHIKSPVQEALHRTGDAGKMNRRTEDDAVGGFHQLNDFIYFIVDDAAFIFQFAAGTAGETAPNRLVPYLNNTDIDAFFFQFRRYGFEGLVGVSLFSGTAIYCKYLH